MMRGILCAAGVCALLLAGCGGDGSDSTATTDERPSTTAPTTTPDDAMATGDGSQIFASNCQSCHGTRGTGGHLGPDLQTSDLAEDPAAIESIVRTGRGQMPAFEGTLDDEEITAVVEHVSGELAPLN